MDASALAPRELFDIEHVMPRRWRNHGARNQRARSHELAAAVVEMWPRS